jgi:hypothetical protein
MFQVLFYYFAIQKESRKKMYICGNYKIFKFNFMQKP